MRSEAGYNWRIDQIPEVDIAIFWAASNMGITVCKTAVRFERLQEENSLTEWSVTITLWTVLPGK